MGNQGNKLQTDSSKRLHLKLPRLYTRQVILNSLLFTMHVRDQVAPDDRQTAIYWIELQVR